jgi:hypothetical protein
MPDIEKILDGLLEIRRDNGPGSWSPRWDGYLDDAIDAIEKLMNPEKPDNCPVCDKTTLVIEHGQGCWHIGCSDAFLMTPEGSERCHLRPSHMDCVSRENAVQGWNKWARGKVNDEQD